LEPWWSDGSGYGRREEDGGHFAGALDTNALMMPEQFGIDIFGELERLGYFEFLVPSPVIDELNWIATSASSGRDKRSARVALGLAAMCREIKEPGEADLVLERLALRTGAAVLTSDKELKKRLISSGVTVIYLRQRRYLEIAAQKEF